ncbi:hypothetical protein E2C01_046636 [Portunus trituberculatus]|uniref:Uncharacterized protein n=1 Tax=Portunus trituberculatus TaxID=210409 RepID=A0A5B7FYD6_PORTR|nr:hypothetical protein [Portunus trituberculatus]
MDQEYSQASKQPYLRGRLNQGTLGNINLCRSVSLETLPALPRLETDHLNPQEVEEDDLLSPIQ